MAVAYTQVFVVFWGSKIENEQTLVVHPILFVVVVFRQLIYNYPEQLFADAGVMAIEHADFEGVERLALVLGMFNKEEEFCFLGNPLSPAFTWK